MDMDALNQLRKDQNKKTVFDLMENDLRMTESFNYTIYLPHGTQQERGLRFRECQFKEDQDCTIVLKYSDLGEEDELIFEHVQVFYGYDAGITLRYYIQYLPDKQYVELMKSYQNITDSDCLYCTIDINLQPLKKYEPHNFAINNFVAKNFCGIQDLQISFEQNTNLIIGENGSGKTSLMKGISKWLSNLFRFVPNLTYQEIEDGDTYFTSSSQGDSTAQIEYSYPTLVGGTLEFLRHLFSFTYSKNSSAHNSDIDSDDICNKFLTLFNHDDQPLFLVDYLSAGRTYEDVTIRQFSMDKTPFSREDGYKDCLSAKEEESFRKAEIWCLQMELLEFQRKKPVEEYKKLKNAVLKFFQTIEPEDQPTDIHFSTKFGTMVLVQGDEEKPIYSLSDGYKYLYGMILDLMYRATLLNPQADFPIEQTEGIVLIDEIDVHLHPRWQWRVIDALRAVLPKVQFIIATHSPMIISSAKDANIIRLLEPDQAINISGYYGTSTDDILRFSQGSTDVPEALDGIYMTLQDAFDVGDMEKASDYLNNVRDRYGKDSPEARKAQEYYEMNKWIGEGV